MDNRAYLERAAEYDTENAGKSRTMIKKAGFVCTMISQQTNGKPVSILEVGCGTGLFTGLLAQRFPQTKITATDAFVPMLDLARERLADFHNVTLAQYDAETSGSFTEHFQVVCGVDIIHHLADPVAGLRSWRELTALGGSLVFFESNARNPVLCLRMLNRPEEARFKYNTRQNLDVWATAAGWSSVGIDFVPIHLPNGPRRLWSVIDRIENAMHPLLWPMSGGMIVSGVREG